MTLFGNVMLLGSDYGFTIELVKPTFHLNKHISEGSTSTKTIQSETFIFDDIRTNFQPKDFKTFLIGRSGLTTSILQRMADSWLPPIIEALNKTSLAHKIQKYEMKLRNDDSTSFNHRICRWIKESIFIGNQLRIHVESGNRSISFSMNGSNRCNGDFYLVKGANNVLISLVLDYQPETWTSPILLKQRVDSSIPPPPLPTSEPSEYGNDETKTEISTMLQDDFHFTEPTPSFQEYHCAPLKIRNIEATIEFEIEEQTKEILKIKNTFIDFPPNPEDSNTNLFCLSDRGSVTFRRTELHSLLQEKLAQYLTILLIS